MKNMIEFDCWCPSCGHEFNHRTHSASYVFCPRCDYDFDSRDFSDCCKLIGGGIDDSQS